MRIAANGGPRSYGAVPVRVDLDARERATLADVADTR
jgi:hypothetical protein